MLTAAELRAIVERHVGWEAPAGHANPLAAALHMSQFAAAAQADRGALLDLLRAVAKYTDADEIEGEHYCLFCRAGVYGPPGARLSLRQDHAADCPAPTLEALREER